MDYRLIKILLVMIVMTVAGLEDIRDRRIGILPAVLVAILGGVLSLVEGSLGLSQMALGLISGLLLILVAKYGKDMLGQGDGYIFVMTGMNFGFFANVILLFTAMAEVAAVGLCYSLIKGLRTGCSRIKLSLPFVPFILLAYLIYLFGGSYAYY